MSITSIYLFLLSICYVLLIFFEASIISIPWIRYLPYLITLPIFCATFINFNLNKKPSHVNEVLPFLVLGSWISISSLAARFLYEVPNTAFVYGIGILLVPMTSHIISTKFDLKRFSYLYYYLVLGMFLLSLIGLALAKINNYQILHEEIFFVISAPIILLRDWKENIVKYLYVALLILITALLSSKITTYITMLFIIFSLLYIKNSKSSNKNPITKSFFVMLSSILGLTVLGVSGYVIENREVYLPSGNVEYRIYMYELAWENFKSSPIWGDFFLGSIVNEFSLYQINFANNILLPTHSDILDILSHGGIAGLALFLLGVLRLNLANNFDYNMSLSSHENRLMNYLGMSLSCALITMAVNPVLVNPLLSFILWFHVGLYIVLIKKARINAYENTRRSQ